MTAKELVGPLKDVVRFQDGTVLPYVPIHGCICWDGNPDNFEGPQRDCPTHGEHASAPAFDPHHVDSAFGPDAIAHLRREAHQLRHEADLVRADGAVDEAAVLEQEAAEIETRIDSTDGDKS